MRVAVTYAVPVQVWVDVEEGTVSRVVTIDEDVHHQLIEGSDKLLGIPVFYDLPDGAAASSPTSSSRRHTTSPTIKSGRPGKGGSDMGADLLIYTLAHKADVTLDFEAGRRWLDQLTVERLKELYDANLDEVNVGFDLQDLLSEAAKEGADDSSWQYALTEVRETLGRLLGELPAIVGLSEGRGPRDVTSMQFAGWWLYIAGGMSWGDIPGDSAEVIDGLSSDYSPLGWDLLTACGFDWPDDSGASSNAITVRLS